MKTRELLFVWLMLVLALFASGCGWELCAPGYVPGRYGCIISCRDFPEGGPIRCYTVRDGMAFDTGVDAVLPDVREDQPDVPTAHVDASMDRDDVLAVDAMDASDTSDGSTASDASDASDTGVVVDTGPVIDPGLAAPRAIAPMSTSTVTSQRPTLRWQNGPSHDGAVVELSRTRDFARIERTERVTGDRARPSSALSAGVWFWRLRGRASARNAEGTMSSPVWWFRVGTRSADGDRDTSWGTELDVNGDGYTDVAVGSPGADMGRGRVDVFYGGPSGIASTPSVTLRGAAVGDGFGYSVASAGDVNGDGFADLVVGANGADPGGRLNAGTASVYLGSASGISASAHRVLEGVAVDDRFGYSVASAGDVNGDGFADLVVGAYWADPGGRTNAGMASVYLGSASGLSASAHRVLEGAASRDLFGCSVASAGDVNGDGFADLVVGAYFADPGGRTNAGTASVYLGSASGLSANAHRVFEGTAADDWFGYSVASAGDVNGDGFADLVVGAYLADPGGRMGAGTASVYLGSASGLSVSAHRVLEGAAAGNAFGFSVASAGDVNGDGFADLVVGAYGAEPGGRMQAGTASVYLGSASGLSASAHRILEGAASYDYFGYSVASAGDVNGDGFADLVVGAYGADPGGRTNAGTASVYLGSASGLSASAHRVLEGVAAGDVFGWSVASAG